MKNIAGLLILCSIGMCCLAIPISEPFDDGSIEPTMVEHGRTLLRSRPAPARAPARAPPAPARAPPVAVRAPARAPPAPARAPPVAVRAPVHVTSRSRVHRPHKTVVIIVKRPVGSIVPVPIPVSIPVPIPTVMKVASVSGTNVMKQETAVDKWLVTTEGVHAAQFCKSLGLENKPQIYDGCIEDMMVMKNEDIAKLGAITAEEFLAKAKAVGATKRYCIASGDPHFTSYDRDIYHLQETGIFVIAGSDDDKFEVQERVKKNGANKPGVPCCIIGAAVRFGDVTIEVDVYNYGKIRVNGVSLEIAKDTTKTYGGVQVRYGKQTIAWRGAKAQTTAMTISGPGGFSVMIEGGYCGALEVNVPTEYFGKMKGLCGNADGTATNADFSSPDGKAMDVKRGAKDWQMSGYGGPTSPLSKWQLSWKPVGTECLFAAGCEPASSATGAAPIVLHAKRAAEKVATASVKVIDANSVNADTVSSKSHDKLDKSDQPKNLVAAIHKFHKDTQSKMHDLKSKIELLLKQNADKQREELVHSENDYKKSKKDADEVSFRYSLYAKRLGDLKNDIVIANSTFLSHYQAMMSDNAYLLKLQLFRPSFIATLENLKHTLSGLEAGVGGLIGLKPSEKVELAHLMFKLRNSTFATTDDVANDFLKFLEKHKAVLTADTSKTDDAKKNLDRLERDYVDASKLSKAAYDEYLKFAEIVKSLKLQFASTSDETEMFDQLMHRVLSMLQAGSGCSSTTISKRSFIHDGSRKSCAVDLVKSHLHNNLV